jgi:hypothetical protein
VVCAQIPWVMIFASAGCLLGYLVTAQVRCVNAVLCACATCQAYLSCARRIFRAVRMRCRALRRVDVVAHVWDVLCVDAAFACAVSVVTVERLRARMLSAAAVSCAQIIPAVSIETLRSRYGDLSFTLVMWPTVPGPSGTFDGYSGWENLFSGGWPCVLCWLCDDSGVRCEARRGLYLRVRISASH